MLDLSLVIGGDLLLATMRLLDDFKKGHYGIQSLFVKDKDCFFVERLGRNE